MVTERLPSATCLVGRQHYGASRGYDGRRLAAIRGRARIDRAIATLLGRRMTRPSVDLIVFALAVGVLRVVMIGTLYGQ